MSNIKNYGISEELLYYANVYRIKKECKKSSWLFPDWYYTKKKTRKTVEIDKKRYDSIINGEKVPIYGLFSEYDREYITYGELLGGDEYEINLNISLSREGVDYIKVNEGYILYARHRGEILIEATPDDVFCVRRKYLYITTYQNDNFKFYEDEIDINTVMNNIDKFLL